MLAGATGQAEATHAIILLPRQEHGQHGTGMPVWVDCDAGVDDAQGLVLCLSLADVECQGVSCVFGNVSLEQVGRNVARVCQLCAKPVPIYLGAADPLVAESPDASLGWDGHGKDGLGDVPDVAPATSSVVFEPRGGHAAVRLAEAVSARPGEVVVVALGPLTNIALALKLDPTIAAKWKRLVVMGGAETSGNASPTAEFNFAADPEAARIVLAACPSLQLVTWECTLRHPVPAALLARWAALPHPKARFLLAIMNKSLQWEACPGKVAEWIACDALAMAVAVRPELVVEARQVWGAVEVQGSALVRGMLVLDRRSSGQQRVANLEVVGQVHMEAFLQLLEASLLPSGGV